MLVAEHAADRAQLRTVADDVLRSRDRDRLVDVGERDRRAHAALARTLLDRQVDVEVVGVALRVDLDGEELKFEYEKATVTKAEKPAKAPQDSDDKPLS